MGACFVGSLMMHVHPSVQTFAFLAIVFTELGAMRKDAHR